MEGFRITQKHYNTILKQGLDNLPQEVGGFLGGKNFMIQGILPLFNAHLYNKTDTFSFTQEDVYRAHQFCDKHGLEYYGLYHTHPNGVAYPSQADIDTGHKYHFILSLREPEKPVFAAYRIDNGKPVQLPFTVVSDKGFSSKDKQQGTKPPSAKVHRTPDEEVEKLSEMIYNIRNEQQNKYPVMPPKNEDRSDFSTLA